VPAPFCSVVLATRNRRASLARALDGLQRQEAPGPVELIVVDDGSTDDTPELLAPLAAQGRLVALRTTGMGPAAARNRGFAVAGAGVVACTDDDCEVPPDWTARLALRLESTGAAAVGGRVRVPADAAVASRVSQAITNGFVTALNRDPAQATFLMSNNIAYRASALRDAGGFNEAFVGPGAEDRDLHLRLRQRGGRLVYADDIVVLHRPPLTAGGFLRQQLGYGRGARLYYDGLRPAAARPRHIGPRDYSRAFAAALADARPAERPVFLAGIVASQAAVLLGYLLGPRR
jgi:GT2 family glycosyltransferase